MAWEWSHTPEAYANVEKNIYKLSLKKLREIYSEWQAHLGDSDLDEVEYEAALKFSKSLSKDHLADFIWQKTCSWRTCDNGGYNAHVCPFGCHTVPF